MSKTKTPNILLDGEIVSRNKAAARLRNKGVPRIARDWILFSASTEEELQVARNDLLLQLRCHLQTLGAIVE